jgi:hypothetical protein
LEQVPRLSARSQVRHASVQGTLQHTPFEQFRPSHSALLEQVAPRALSPQEFGPPWPHVVGAWH